MHWLHLACLSHLQRVLVGTDPVLVVALRRGQNTAWFAETSPRSQTDSLWLFHGSAASGTLLEAHPREQFMMNKPWGDGREVLDIPPSFFVHRLVGIGAKSFVALSHQCLKGFVVNVDHTKKCLGREGRNMVFFPGPLCQHLPPSRLQPGG